MKIRYFGYLETLLRELGNEVYPIGLGLEQIDQLEKATEFCFPQAFRELLTLVGVEAFQINDEVGTDINEIIRAQKIFRLYVRDNVDVNFADHDFFILLMAADEPVLLVSNESDNAPLYWGGPDQLSRRSDVKDLPDYFRKTAVYRKFLYRKVAVEKRQCISKLSQRLKSYKKELKIIQDSSTSLGFRVDLYFPDYALGIWIIDPEKDEGGLRLANTEKRKAEENGIKSLLLKSSEVLDKLDVIVKELRDNYLTMK